MRIPSSGFPKDPGATFAAVAILGVDVGGTFTDAVLLDDGELRDGQGADAPRRAGGVGARGRGAPSARRTSSGSRTGRRSRRTRCSSARARARPSSRPTASSTCCTCAARPARTSTGSATRAARAARAARALPRRPRADRARTACSCRSTARLACRSWRRRGGRRLPALLVPRPVARAAVADELRRRLPGAHVVASHEVAPEFREYERASTTAVDAYLGPSAAALPRRARGALPRGRPAGAARDALVRRRRDARRGGGARGARASSPARPAARSARRASRRWRASRTRSPSTWAARRPTSA